ncbi:hypothetical protein A2631_03580 [Candidatus Daviesbacteria bacterium RIFCSPHIGHO2_01_FULL_44_29]|uniref:Type II secretion system protein GspI C-terminal domain-containing protein n=1 Tax=Candidatus Daviesbacteria bacterium RIFCSPHIGHO2_02_FULL_43_12 TaxID=1797776 RepID=A0A1F5KFK6_9BACT|nr:MAG: hypothetical protein A2631_03580 [Candidatus Daviesbacteria bacterium RIFCSPHIGHO2_01_FULL_44_29]OGE38820.1 MAG: hypothetical protein A3E86_02805 [Candidatus Daviesbacteria bacterium RIFCSPHIGHO2_12_FULL_47_45]OGE39717.1 MAG: hypothetical protein A3D25_03245 [Candidatus Daviesbacteria bacterium RIFCSPHIGHO2_02_FULL_43_12]OGE69992.1 MAG: hypothetical protein A3B55_04845 [Candidatus Daviesbacteria bacterium RIFCSPLOWO2_01_FULL_43_15]
MTLQNKKTYLKNNRGLSLIEIVLVIMLVGFLGLLLNNLPSSLRLISISNQTSIAKEILLKKIEDLRTTPFANLANGATSFTDPKLVNLSAGEASLVIQDCPISICTLGEVVKQVDLTVTWKDSTSHIRSTALTTLITNGGL